MIKAIGTLLINILVIINKRDELKNCNLVNALKLCIENSILSIASSCILSVGKCLPPHII